MQLEQNVINSIKNIAFPFNLGIEREGLRVRENGLLAETLHPEIFGEKLKNYHIKTDFCESQPELVTSVLPSTQEAYDELSKLILTLKEEISKNSEYFWGQSMPCILPEEDSIKTAVHPGDFAKPLRDYLQLVREKYTATKQTLCGVHFNFSLTDEFWISLKSLENNNASLQEYKNTMYMKMLKNYYSHSWFTILLTGCSPAVDESFRHSYDALQKNSAGIYSSENAPSLHFSRIGYHNPKPVEIDYTDIYTLCNSLLKGVAEKKLIDQGELFAPIKVKAKDNVYLVDSLKNDGVLYLEIRNIDLNMFDKCGISKNDMDFLVLFLIYMLIAPQTLSENWRYTADENSLRTAENGLDYSLLLNKNGKDISIGDWVNEILNELLKLNEHVKICTPQAFEEISDRLRDPKKSYAAMAYNEFLQNGFIDTCIKYAK